MKNFALSFTISYYLKKKMIGLAVKKANPNLLLSGTLYFSHVSNRRNACVNRRNEEKKEYDLLILSHAQRGRYSDIEKTSLQHLNILFKINLSKSCSAHEVAYSPLFPLFFVSSLMAD